MLDFVKKEEPRYLKQTHNVPMKCERCSQNFNGQEWMLRTKKEIICPRCWRYEQEDSV